MSLFHKMAGPLLVDHYSLTTARNVFALGRHETRSCFHHTVRRMPFGGGYLLVAGLDSLADWLDNWHFAPDDIAVLAAHHTDGQPTFPNDFLEFLASSRLTLDIDAVPEGTVMGPQAPLMRVTGAFWQCLMLESAILNIINSQSLFATETSHLVYAANGRPIIEAGLRRAHELGGLAMSRAAYIGGAALSSNMLAGKIYGVPTGGTVMHAFVMLFENELAAFAAQASLGARMFLVDTYDTLRGVENAIAACRAAGLRLGGIRLDSGDLAALSVAARALLDQAGFTDAVITVSNDLGVETIYDLQTQGLVADRIMVGTSLATLKRDPALNGVYKLSAVAERKNALWHDKVKISADSEKNSIPGAQTVLRFADGDVIASAASGKWHNGRLVELLTTSAGTTYSTGTECHELLVPFMRHGKITAPRPSLQAVRDYAGTELARLAPACRAMHATILYPVALEQSLAAQRANLIHAAG